MMMFVHKLISIKRTLFVATTLVVVLSPFVESQDRRDHANFNETSLRIQSMGPEVGDDPHRDSFAYRKQMNRFEIRLRENFLNRKQMEDMEKFIDEECGENLKGMNLKECSYKGMALKFLSETYSHLLLHRYSNFEEIKLSTGTQVSEELCLRHLGDLNKRAKALESLRYDSKDSNVARLIDSFGRYPAGFFYGNFFWIGSYNGCLGTKIRTNSEKDGQVETIGTRYCVASVKLKDWPKNDQLSQILSIRVGVCLPDVCDSLNYKNKFNLIEQLLEFNAKSMDINQSEIAELYCLPDEQSKLRDPLRSRATKLVILFGVVWILLLVYATIKDESNRRKKKQEHEDREEKIGLSNGFREPEIPPIESRREKIYRSLSITSNLRSLFSTEKSSLMEVGMNEKEQSSRSMKSIDESKTNKVKGTLLSVNLDVIESIKVLGAIYIITGHVIMISSGLFNDSRELATTKSVMYSISNLQPAFAVNAFFSITGILTSYLILKQNQSDKLITNPAKWLAFILYRYLRIMPLYILATLYCKHIARYTGSGPFWDYGTSPLSARYNCQQESWAWTLLLGANFKNPLKHCIPSGWYLANDFQFFMVTPIFMIALHLRPAFGRKLLICTSILAYLAGVHNILVSDIPSSKPIIRFMLHGFSTYVAYLHENYTRPQYRIPAYLIGLLLGQSLYQYELKRRSHFEKSGLDQAEGNSNETTTREEPGWPDNFKRWGILFSAAVVVLVLLTPSIGSRTFFDESTTKLLLAFYMPALHILYALAVGSYVLLSTTGHGNQMVNGFLSMKFWKPLARLSLCIVLVNVEVISYIAQSHKSTYTLSNQILTSLNVYIIICTYIVATIVCVLFEAPMRSALNNLLVYLVKRTQIKMKKTN